MPNRLNAWRFELGLLMNEQHSSETIAKQSPARVGVILADMGKLNVTALKYLIVHLNTLQRSIEFELLTPDSTDPLLIQLSHEQIVDRDKCRGMLPTFRDRIVKELQREQTEYDLTDQSFPTNFVGRSEERRGG